MSKLLYFLVGIVVSAALFAAPVLSAQDGLPKDVSDYLGKSVLWTERMEADFQVATDYLFKQSTLDKTKAANADFEKLIDEMAATTAPLAMRAIHEQLNFAEWRCRNHINFAVNTADVGKLTAFDGMFIVPQREACIVQIHAARLMIIEVGIANGFDPFSMGKVADPEATKEE